MLRVENLRVVYGRTVAGLRGVSLAVNRCEVVALLGPNGAGKTTLLRAITGLLPLHRGALSGSIEFEGRSVVGMESAAIVRLGVAQVMEGRRIFGDLTIDENLRLGAVTRAGGDGLRAAHERVLDMFPELRERLRERAGYLSGGQQQMLAIGRALMAAPKLLILDEPSLGLAPLVVERIAGVIREINRSGTSILLVEQNAAMALDLSHRAYVIESGAVAKEGPSSALLHDPAVEMLYLGTSAAGRHRIEQDAVRLPRSARWSL